MRLAHKQREARWHSPGKVFSLLYSGGLRLVTVVASALIIGIGLLIFLEIILRKVGGVSTLVAEQFGGFMVVIVTFLGLAIAMQSNTHVRVDIVRRHFPQKMRTPMEILSYLVFIAYGLLLLFLLAKMALTSYQTGQLTQQIFGFPLWIPRVFLPIGVFLLVIELCVELRQLLLKSRKGTDADLTGDEG